MDDTHKSLLTRVDVIVYDNINMYLKTEAFLEKSIEKLLMGEIMRQECLFHITLMHKSYKLYVAINQPCSLICNIAHNALINH